MKDGITWTRIKNDVNANPRYVCHFLSLLKSGECQGLSVHEKYLFAVKRAKRIGGRKYHCKAYGGGIVFQSYSIDELNADIEKLKKGK